MAEPIAVASELITAVGVGELTAKLIAAGGANPPGGEQPTVEVLIETCRRFGLDHEVTTVAPGRPNLIVRLPGGRAPGLLLLGHSDVVPIGDGWTKDPYGGQLVDGRLYGRGAADMKGGLAAMLLAMAAVRHEGVELDGPVELAITVDEEDNALGVRHYLANRSPTLSKDDFLGCIVGEPTDLQPIIAARGDAYLTVTIGGRAAHAGRPSDGLNAIDAAARVLTDLRQWGAELAADDHGLTGPATVSVGRIDGGTGPSIVAAECTMIIDRRLLPSETGAQVLDQLNSRIAQLGLVGEGYRVHTELGLDMPGFETAATEPLVSAVRDADAAAGGPQLPPGGWSAACDGGFLARDAGLPVIVYGPGSVAEQAHRADESVPVDQLAIAAGSYRKIILEILGVS